MAFQHSIRRVYQTNAGIIIDNVETVTGAQQGVDIDTQIMPAAQQEFDVAVNTANVQSLLIFSDQSTTILTNDAASPSSTINVKPNIPIIWTLNVYWPLPVNPGIINKIFITNDGPVAANVKIRMLSN